MADDFKMDITGIQGLLFKLKEGKRPSVIKRSLFAGAVLIAGWSKEKRLSGPRPRYLGVVTGRLRSSIAASRTERIGNTFISRIGTNVKYGRRHELGIGRMHARPFLRPAIEDKGNRREVLNILLDNINEGLNK